MTIGWTVYFAEILSAVCTLEAAILLLFLCFTFFSFCGFVDEDIKEDERKKYYKLVIFNFIVTFIFSLFLVITPTIKQAYRIIGAEYLKGGFEKIENSPITEKAKLAIEKKLDEIIEGK